MSRRNMANEPPPAERIDQYYNLDAAVRWMEDGYYIDWSMIPDTPERILLWEQAFWDAVAPAACLDCGRPMGPGPHHDASCLECRWTLPHHVQREREDEMLYAGHGRF